MDTNRFLPHTRNPRLGLSNFPLDGAVVNHFFIWLQPENPNYDPIIVRPEDEEVMIVGKVVGIYRQLE